MTAIVRPCEIACGGEFPLRKMVRSSFEPGPGRLAAWRPDPSLSSGKRKLHLPAQPRFYVVRESCLSAVRTGGGSRVASVSRILTGMCEQEWGRSSAVVAQDPVLQNIHRHARSRPQGEGHVADLSLISHGDAFMV